MKDWLIKTIIKAQLPKILRHALTVLGAWMATKGLGGTDPDNLLELFTGLTTIGVTVVWSSITKTAPSAGASQFLATVIGAVARQLQTALATFLAVDPNALHNGTISTTAVVMLVVNLIISRLDASDAKSLK